MEMMTVEMIQMNQLSNVEIEIVQLVGVNALIEIIIVVYQNGTSVMV